MRADLIRFIKKHNELTYVITYGIILISITGELHYANFRI